MLMMASSGSLGVSALSESLSDRKSESCVYQVDSPFVIRLVRTHKDAWPSAWDSQLPCPR